MRCWVVSFVVAVGMLASAGVRADEIGAAGEIDVRRRVAILPMVVNASGERAYLRSGLSDMLASRLGRNPALAVLRVEDEALATSDPARAAKTGLELGAQYVVFGSFTQFGEGASLDVHCIEAASYGEDDEPSARRVFIQSGTVGEIIPKLDETAQKIGRFVAGPMPPAVATGPAATSSRAAPAPAGVTADDLAELRERLDAIETFLFGGKDADDVADSTLQEGSASDFGQPN